MQWLRSLRGIGIGKSCLIIGGGNSVLDFDFSQVPDDLTIIGLNDNKPDDITLDLIICFDLCSHDPMTEKGLWDHCPVAGYRLKRHPRMTYYFTDSEMYPAAQHENIGLKALCLARRLLCFDHIYLVGFDFYTVNGVSHFCGDEVGHKKKYMDDAHLRGHINRLSSMPEQFEKIAHWDGIYNCNRESALTIFPYGLPCRERVIA